MTSPALFVASLYNDGQRDRGFSYEYCNLYQPLARVVESVQTFDFMQIAAEIGIARMNEQLLEAVKRERPALTLVVPFTDELQAEVIDEMSRHTTTVAYFFDDMWRLEYSQSLARHFTFVTTSDVKGVRRFHEAGLDNAVYSPFGCNHRIFQKQDLAKIYDVTFVGGYHPSRAWWLQQVRDAGINVSVWGQGWGTGRVEQDDLVRIFNQSKINLNLSNSAEWDLRYVLTLKRPIRDTVRAWRNTARAWQGHDSKNREQVKGRHFEINACGGFQLSYYIEGLERHYRIGDEIALYASPDDLVETIRYYLKHDAERETIARAGYERTSREHTMERRFIDLCEQVGLGRLTTEPP